MASNLIYTPSRYLNKSGIALKTDFIDFTYCLFFGRKKSIEDVVKIEKWIKAKAILDDFDVRRFGEKHALYVLCCIVTEVNFPREIHEIYIRKAEEKMPELLGTEPEHEFHMDEVAYIKHLMNAEFKLEYIRKMYQKK